MWFTGVGADLEALLTTSDCSCEIPDFSRDFFEMVKASFGGKKYSILGDLNVILLDLNTILASQNFYENFIADN